MNLKIVPIHLIPKGEDCPLDDLAYLLKLGLHMENLCDRELGVGLSAVQVGIPLNFFIVRYGDGKEVPYYYRHFVNCDYKSIEDDKVSGVEGCLSIRKENGEFKYFEVSRFKEVRIIGKELLAKPTLDVVDLELIPMDYYTIVFQHEIDHSHQILISDIGKEVYLWIK